MTWQQFVTKWKDCKQCALHTQRERIVLAKGSVPCDVLFVGEAPGESENLIGLPFVGPAGKLLDLIVERGLPSHVEVFEGVLNNQWVREEKVVVDVTYAMTNLVCCFPKIAKRAKINEPERSEILACRPRLMEFINLCQPKLVVTVGTLAEDWLPDLSTGPCAIVKIVHPAHILRMPVAQQGFATQKSIVTIATAVDNCGIVGKVSVSG